MDLITRNSVTYKIWKEFCRHHNHPLSSSPINLLLIGFTELLFERRGLCFRRWNDLWEKFSVIKWLTGRSWVFRFRALRAPCIYCVLALYRKARGQVQNLYISWWVGANIFNFNKRTKATQGEITGSVSSSTVTNWPSQKYKACFPRLQISLGHLLLHPSQCTLITPPKKNPNFILK